MDVNMLNKKADAGLVVVVIIILIIIFLGWAITIGNRECSNNKDCGDEYYCGSDFKCHEYPTIEKKIVHVDYTKPALIIAIAILLVFLGPKVFGFLKERKEQKHDEKTEESKIEDETEKKKTKKEQVYYNYPTYKPTYKSSYSIKSKIKEHKKLFFNNYVGFILGGLTALGIILITKLDYIGISVFGAILLFYLVYKLWSYCLNYKLEYYLIAVLSLIYVIFAFIYFSKGGLFTSIGFGFLIITIFVIKETISWVKYRKL